MALLRSLVLTPSFEYHRESLTQTTKVEFDGSNFQQRYNRRQRPLYRFECTLYPLKRSEDEYLMTFHAFHQGGRSFMFDGGPYATIRNYNLFGEGDGGTTQFFIPNRYITATSFSIQSENQSTLATSIWSTGYSLNPNPGIVTFTSAPSSGHDLKAIYACRYRCFFEPDGLKFSEFASNLFKVTLKLEEAEIF